MDDLKKVRKADTVMKNMEQLFRDARDQANEIVQGLHDKIAALEKENASLKAELAAIKQGTANVVAPCAFTWTSPRYHPSLFDISGNGEEGLRGTPISLGTISTENALKQITKKGKRPMNFAEALRWFAANPDKEGWFVALGAKCIVTEDGKEIPCALVLYRGGSDRGLNVIMLADDWDDDYRFLVV